MRAAPIWCCSHFIYKFTDDRVHSAGIVGNLRQEEDEMSGFRIEKDSLGDLEVPSDALYAAQTQRAVENFPISGLRQYQAFIWSMASDCSPTKRWGRRW